MTAALEAANTGYKVFLVEKEPELGGFARKLYKKIPTRDFKEPIIVDTDIEKIAKEVESHPNIKVYKSSRVEKTEGQPGLFDVTISGASGTETVKIGAIVMATGWVPYDATKLGHLGYGKFKDVVTNVEFEAIAKQGRDCKAFRRQRSDEGRLYSVRGEQRPRTICRIARPCAVRPR